MKFVLVAIFFLISSLPTALAVDCSTFVGPPPPGTECDPSFVGPPAPSSQNSGPIIIDNPIGIDNLQDLANRIGGVLVDLAIPIAVIMIIWSGVQFLIAGGNTEMITKAKNTLKWAIIGLAVIFIGKGFITLIQDILSLKDK